MAASSGGGIYGGGVWIGLSGREERGFVVGIPGGGAGDSLSGCAFASILLHL